MKNKSLFLAALVMFLSAVAFAGKDEPRKTGIAIVPVKGSGVFKVIYKGENVGKVKLNIYNASGSIILSETINGVDGFICPVNFSGLSYGDYTIELVDATGKKVEKISYQQKPTIKHIHVGKIVNEENKFLLAISNAGNEVIDLKIFDANNQLVHNESKSISGDFAQVYKLANDSASYTFKVTDRAGNTKTIKTN